MEKNILYFDCFSGISGDMIIGALLDMGVQEGYLVNELKKLNIDGYKIEIKKGLKKGIAGTDFNVILDHHEEACHKHKHDHKHCHEEHHHHGHHEKHHEQEHKSVENEGHHHSRNINDIFSIIDNSNLNENIKEMSKKIFMIIGEAEAKIHAKSIEEIHFHEIGAIDSIIDIIGSAICIDKLGIDEIYSSPVNVGGGFVQCQHGVMPVPAPATVEILKNVPVYSNGIKKELTTPTGAGILKALAKEFVNMPEMIIEKSGYGLGKRDLENHANVLRCIIGKKN